MHVALWFFGWLTAWIVLIASLRLAEECDAAPTWILFELTAGLSIAAIVGIPFYWLGSLLWVVGHW